MTEKEFIDALRGFAFSMSNCASSPAAMSLSIIDCKSVILKSEITFRKIIDICNLQESSARHDLLREQLAAAQAEVERLVLCDGQNVANMRASWKREQKLRDALEGLIPAAKEVLLGFPRVDGRSERLASKLRIAQAALKGGEK